MKQVRKIAEVDIEVEPTIPRPVNPQDDVMAQAIGAGLRRWAANNYRPSGGAPTPSTQNTPSSSDVPQPRQGSFLFDAADKTAETRALHEELHGLDSQKGE